MTRLLPLLLLLALGCGQPAPPPPETEQEAEDRHLAELRAQRDARRAARQARKAPAVDWSAVPDSELRSLTLELLGLG